MDTDEKTRTRTAAETRRKGANSTARPGEARKPAVTGDAKRLPVVTDDERRRLIAEAAYLAAERRSFRGGSAERDWLDAEAEIDARLLRREQSNSA